MATAVYDVVVVGAGLMGSSAAYYAAKQGKRVLVLEQFELLHDKGSSHGASRIFRVGYPNDIYTKLCLTSLEMWRALENEAGVELLQLTGELDFAPERIDDLVHLEKTLERHNVPFEVLTGAQANKRFPGFSLPADSHAVYNPMAGVLNPAKAMASMHKLSRELGVEFRERNPVKSVAGERDADGTSLAVVTLADGTQVHGHQCIVTAGPWTDKVLKRTGADNVTLQPIATFGMYWRCKQELYTPDKFPVFIKYGYPEVYGIPLMDPKEGVKICRHDGPNVNPDARLGVTQPVADQTHLRGFIAENFSHVDSSAPNQVDDCMYTMTKDDNFLIDFFPIPSNDGSAAAAKYIVVGAGFSGHGAKMTLVIGQILADLAIKGKTQHSTELFRISREAAPLEPKL